MVSKNRLIHKLKYKLIIKADEGLWGLPLFPDAYNKAKAIKTNTFYSCMKCGETKILNKINQECSRCHHHSWAESLKTRRLA